ncbi:hypothetical protein ANO11243_073960 [Dothideomycetidae sp. 11243]|nr:hypothetical protein ANO11243_073960 [fungal sp. No.11243]
MQLLGSTYQKKNSMDPRDETRGGGRVEERARKEEDGKGEKTLGRLASRVGGRGRASSFEANEWVRIGRGAAAGAHANKREREPEPEPAPEPERGAWGNWEHGRASDSGWADGRVVEGRRAAGGACSNWAGGRQAKRTGVTERDDERVRVRVRVGACAVACARECVPGRSVRALALGLCCSSQKGKRHRRPAQDQPATSLRTVCSHSRCLNALAGAPAICHTPAAASTCRCPLETHDTLILRSSRSSQHPTPSSFAKVNRQAINGNHLNSCNNHAVNRRDPIAVPCPLVPHS